MFSSSKSCLVTQSTKYGAEKIWQNISYPTVCQPGQHCTVQMGSMQYVTSPFAWTCPRDDTWLSARILAFHAKSRWSREQCCQSYSYIWNTHRVICMLNLRYVVEKHRQRTKGLVPGISKFAHKFLPHFFFNNSNSQWTRFVSQKVPIISVL